jgi:hypothetical protein
MLYYEKIQVYFYLFTICKKEKKKKAWYHGERDEKNCLRQVFVNDKVCVKCRTCTEVTS